MTNIPKCFPVKKNEIKHGENADDCKSKGHRKRQIKLICQADKVHQVNIWKSYSPDLGTICKESENNHNKIRSTC